MYTGTWVIDPLHSLLQLGRVPLQGGGPVTLNILNSRMYTGSWVLDPFFLYYYVKTNMKYQEQTYSLKLMVKVNEVLKNEASQQNI